MDGRLPLQGDLVHEVTRPVNAAAALVISGTAAAPLVLAIRQNSNVMKALDVTPIPPGYHSISPFLLLNDIDGFLEFVRKAFDVQVVRALPDATGRVMHAEIRLGDSHIMIGDPMGKHEPRPASLYFYVPDVDAVYRQAIEAGGTSVLEPADQFYGDRNGGVQDAWGNIWWLATHIEDVSEGELQRRNPYLKDSGSVVR